MAADPDFRPTSPLWATVIDAELSGSTGTGSDPEDLHS
ncbi:MAG: hypothetical protein JWP90_501 [Mycetocola sp.]|jgi:hypothetical protein|nr:hypothetical protein [Mycetocola sp.]